MMPLAQTALGTEEGRWLLVGLAVLAFIVALVGGVLTCLVKWKQLRAPAVQNENVGPQPFIVALEKEFVPLAKFEQKTTELHQEIKEGRSYAHDEVHRLSETINAITIDGHNRAERLVSVETDVKTLVRQHAATDGKIDKLIGLAGELQGRTQRKP